VGRQFSLIPPEFNSFGWINPETFEGEDSSWSDFVNQYMIKYAGRLVDGGRLDKEIADKLLYLTKKFTPNLERASLIHRDLKPFNLMVGERVAILDWENAMLGDALFDAGVLLSRFPDDQRVYNAFSIGLLNNKEIEPEDSETRIRTYSLVNLVGAICFFGENAPREFFQRLETSIQELDSPSRKSLLAPIDIEIPALLPEYWKNPDQ
jgi:hypothetical protein